MSAYTKLKVFVICTTFTTISISADSIYCPEHQAYISYGMTADQVLAACGQPTYMNSSSDAVVQTTPMTQLIYSNLNQGAGGAVYQGFEPVYQTWSLPSGSVGVNLQFDIVNNKISSIQLNGSSTNAATVCGGTNLQIGSDVNAVYAACGSPSISNQTFIKQNVSMKDKPEVWVYQMEYRPTMRLTFVNGVLQSIN